MDLGEGKGTCRSHGRVIFSGNTYKWIQIHMCVDEIWQGVISERFSEEENPRTVVV